MPPPPSTGERGLEVCCHGDRPPLPVDLCVCVCLRHIGHVHAAALPELHSQDHHQLARLTTPPAMHTLTDSSPDQSAQQKKGQRLGCGRVWGFLGVNGTGSRTGTEQHHAHYLYSTFFAMNNCFSGMKKRENAIILLPAVFCPDV